MIVECVFWLDKIDTLSKRAGMVLDGDFEKRYVT